MRRDDPAALSAELAEKMEAASPTKPRSRLGALASALRLIYVDDVKIDLDTVWLVKGLIPERGLIAVYGKHNVGKTAINVDLAFNIAAGTPWRDRPVLQGGVVYVASEAGASILRRMVAWRDYRLSDSREGRVPLIICTTAVMLTNAVEVEMLAEQIRAEVQATGIELRAIVIDTLATSMMGDENGPDMSVAVTGANRLRELLNCAVLLVHHPGKDESRGLRGNSSLPAAADTILHVTEGQVTIEKQRDGPTGESFAFELEVVDLGVDSDGDTVRTVIVKHLQDGESRFRQAKPRGLQPTAKMGFQALEEAILQYGEPMGSGSSTIPAGVRAVRIEDWRRQYYLRIGRDTGETKDETAKKAFQRARMQLAAAGHVGMSDPWAWVSK